MSEPKVYKCEECGKVCKNGIGLSGHKRSHLKAKSQPKSLEVLREKAEQVAQSHVQAKQGVEVKERQLSEYEQAMGLKAQEEAAVKAVVKSEDFTRYKELPPPVVDWLEKNYGDWLRHLAIGQEWREDFGGYALYVKVPRRFSTEWKEIDTPVYDNELRRIVDTKHEILPDERWCSLADVPKAINWLERVKMHIMTNAYRQGLQLPSTNTGIDQTKQSLAEYEKSVAGIK